MKKIAIMFLVSHCALFAMQRDRPFDFLEQEETVKRKKIKSDHECSEIQNDLNKGFLKAVIFDDIKEAEDWLLKGASVNALRKSGFSALHIIMSKLPEEKVLQWLDLLMKYQPDSNHKDFWRGKTAVMMAIENHFFAATEKLFELGVDMEITDNNGNDIIDYVLNIPFSQKRTNFFKLLSTFSKDKNFLDLAEKRSNQRGYSEELLNAASFGYLEGVQETLESGADVNFQDKDGLSALHLAILEPSEDSALKLVECLLQYSPHLDSKSKDGLTPLGTALAENFLVIAKKLLAAGADPNVPDKDKKISLHYALELKEKRLEMIELLVDVYGANFDAVDIRRQSAILWAVAHGDTALVKYFVDKGAYVPHDRFILHTAAQGGYFDIVKLLLPQLPIGCIDEQDKQGETVLHKFVHYGDQHMIEKIIAYKPNPLLKNKYQKTPFDIAVANKDMEKAEFLQKYTSSYILKNQDSLN